MTHFTSFGARGLNGCKFFLIILGKWSHKSKHHSNGFRCTALFFDFLKLCILNCFYYLLFSHIKNTGDMFEFAIVSEEAISKGIRRIVAVSGHEAEKVNTLNLLSLYFIVIIFSIRFV